MAPNSDDSEITLLLTWQEFIEVWKLVASKVLLEGKPEPGSAFESLCKEIRTIVDAKDL